MLNRRIILFCALVLIVILSFGFISGAQLGARLVQDIFKGGTAVVVASVPGMKQRTCGSEIVAITRATKAVALGNAYFGGSKEYDLVCARAAYAQASVLDSHASPVLWHQYGRVDFLESRFDGAIEKFNRQVDYYGDEIPNVHYMLGLTYGYKARKTGQAIFWKRAEEEFTKYILLDSRGPWARVDLAWVYFAQGKFEEMKPVLEKGLAMHPDHPWLLNMYGLSLLNTEDKEGAKLYFEAAVRSVKKLTIADWGAAYPGNNPAQWEGGLQEMIRLYEANLASVTTSVTN